MKLQITVDGKQYEVEVEVAEDVEERNPAGYLPPTYVSSPAAPTPPPPAAPKVQPSGDVVEDKVCRSPIAGIVVKVNVQVGQQLQVNDQLMVLEAMKMETNITSPATGKVKAVNVGQGDPVQVGQILVEFE